MSIHFILGAQILQYLLCPLLFLLSVFIILLVLIQRGKGGGLSGAFGGAGGQSAFGARATEQITWVTAATVGLWILVCAASVILLKAGDKPFGGDSGDEPSGGALVSPENGAEDGTTPGE